MEKTWITPGGTSYALYKDMLKQPHMLIAGATGSGKSVVINALMYHALYHAPGNCDLILIDPKKVELAAYRRLPHCIAYACEITDIIAALERAVSIMKRRISTMQRKGIKEWNGGDLYVVIDEFADLMVLAKKQCKPLLCEIAMLGRAARVHLIAATQRPTRDIIDGSIKVNMDSRLALRCPTAQDSRNIINISGAELLPRYGQGYYLTPDTVQPQLYNLPMISYDELTKRCEFWEEQKHPLKRLIKAFRYKHSLQY